MEREEREERKRTSRKQVRRCHRGQERAVCCFVLLLFFFPFGSERQGVKGEGLVVLLSVGKRKGVRCAFVFLPRFCFCFSFFVASRFFFSFLFCFIQRRCRGRSTILDRKLFLLWQGVKTRNKRDEG